MGLNVAYFVETADLALESTLLPTRTVTLGCHANPNQCLQWLPHPSPHQCCGLQQNKPGAHNQLNNLLYFFFQITFLFLGDEHS
jgi:hypothetical protein